MSSLKEKVYEFVKSIPPGKVATYGQIALHLGNRNFARVVGNILHGNPDPEHIPCHRVVNSKGQLSQSYAFGGIEAQRRLLVSEGVVFKNNQVVDLSVSQMVWLALHSSIKLSGGG
ncbi:MAG: MGMT family protein [Lentisphaeria bacterium]|nr:MGMT family protein [Lentisphaeria bacterium]